MRKYVFILLIMLSCESVLDSKKELHAFSQDSYIININKLDVNSSAIDCDHIKTSFTKDLFLAEIAYLSDGIVNDSLFSKKPQEFSNKREGVIYNYSYGDYLLRSSKSNDSLAYEYYQRAYREAKATKDSVLCYAALVKVNRYFQKRNKLSKIFELYQKELAIYAKAMDEPFWAAYFKVNVHLLKVYQKELPLSSLSDLDFERLLNICPNDSYFKGLVYQLQGIFHNLLLKDAIKGAVFFEKAEQAYMQSSLFLAKQSLYGLALNKGITAYESGAYTEAVHQFKDCLAMIPDVKSQLDKKQFIAEWLWKSYAELRETDSVTHYLKEEAVYKEKRKEFELAKTIYEIDTLYDVKEKNKEISSLQKIKIEFKRHKFIYGFIIAIVFVIALYSMIRWLRSDLKNKQLHIEKKQAEEELKNVKQLVEEDYIMLKNKTKVFLKELIYIKSDDHYLILVTQDKKHFVRGKLKDILKELPPNFSQCHRSYLVNRNYINSIHGKFIKLKGELEMPLSRTYAIHFKE